MDIAIHEKHPISVEELAWSEYLFIQIKDAQEKPHELSIHKTQAKLLKELLGRFV